jgi:hypothetical protein
VAKKSTRNEFEIALPEHLLPMQVQSAVVVWNLQNPQAALNGEAVRLEDNKVYFNGQIELEEAALLERATALAQYLEGSFKLPQLGVQIVPAD